MSSNLSSKSFLKKKSVEREIPSSVSLDEALELDSSVVTIRDGKLYESRESAPLDQGSFGGSEEYVSAYTNGFRGWKAVSGASGQHDYGGPVFHESEYVGGGLEDSMRERGGTYMAVSVNDDETDEPQGWMLLRKCEASDFPAPDASATNDVRVQQRSDDLREAVESGDHEAVGYAWSRFEKTSRLRAGALETNLKGVSKEREPEKHKQLSDQINSFKSVHNTARDYAFNALIALKKY